MWIWAAGLPRTALLQILTASLDLVRHDLPAQRQLRLQRVEPFAGPGAQLGTSSTLYLPQIFEISIGLVGSHLIWVFGWGGSVWGCTDFIAPPDPDQFQPLLCSCQAIAPRLLHCRRRSMVGRCLAVTKSVVGMAADPGYGSMSDRDDEEGGGC
jgi:hypothetical protein